MTGEVEVRILDFALYGDYLYAIDVYNLFIYSLDQPEEPELINTIERLDVGSGAVYTWDNFLYAGNDIYSLEDPENPHLVEARGVVGAPAVL